MSDALRRPDTVHGVKIDWPYADPDAQRIRDAGDHDAAAGKFANADASDRLAAAVARAKSGGHKFTAYPTPTFRRAQGRSVGD